jgi:hypothetical protein
MLTAGVLGLRVKEPSAAGDVTVTFSQMETFPDNGRCRLVIIQ